MTSAPVPLTKQQLQFAIISGCKGITTEEKVHGLMVLNVPAIDIQIQVQDSAVQKIGDVKNSSKKRLAFLIDTLHKKQLGTNIIGNPLFCKDTVPKTSVFVESLLAKDQKTIVGERFWFMVFDEQYKINAATKDILAVNKRHTEVLPIASKNKIINPFVESVRQLVDFESLALSLYIPYLEKCDPSFNLQEIRNDLTKESFFLDENAAFSAEKIFSPKNAFRFAEKWEICDQQKNLENYFEESDPTPMMFKRQFVMPKCVIRITPDWSSLERITALPLPRSYFDINTQRETIQKDVDQLEDLVGQMSLDEQENSINEQNPELVEYLNQVNRKKTELAEIEESHSSGMAQGNSLLEGGLTDDNCKRIMKMRSAFWILKDKNLAEISEIHQRFPRKESQSHRDAMETFYKKAVKECFDILMDETIAEKTESVRTAVKWFKSLPPEEQWVENLLTCANLSPFGNTMVQLMDRADKGIDHPIETNFQLFLLCFFAALTSFQFSWELRPNLLISGDGGTGKSHVIEAVQSIISPGASMRFGHMTLRSQDIDLDLSQATLFCDEMPLHYLGVDPQGRPIAADGPFKDRVAKQYSSVLSFKKDEATGRRMADLQVSRQMQTLIFANNNPCPPAESALMQRFVPIYVNKLYRRDREQNASVFRTQHHEILELQKEITRYLQLHCTYQLFYNVFIEAGVLPPIDNQALILLSKWVFERLTKHNISDLSARRMDQMKMLCNQVHMFHAINVEFFSETGLHHRMRNGKPKRLEAEDFLGLLKHGAVFQEEAAFTMTLLEGVLVPKFKHQLCQVFIKQFCHVDDPMLIPCHSASFRKTLRDQPDGNERYNVDYNYVSIVGTSYAQIYQLFSKTVEGRPSQNVVNNILNDMRNEYIEVNIREKVDVDIPEQGNQTCIIVRDATKKTNEKHPLVIFDTDPQSKTNKRISLLIDALPPTDIHKYQNVLLDAIQESLSFDQQIDSDIVTAVPYVRLVRKEPLSLVPSDKPDVLDEKSLKPECFPSLLSLIRVSNNPKEKRFLENPYAFTPLDLLSLYNRVGSKYGNSIMSIDRFSTEPISRFDMPLDDYFFHSYCLNAGIDPEKNASVLPINHKSLAVSLRRTDPYFKTANLWIRNYPVDNVRCMDKMFEKRNDKDNVKQVVSRLCVTRDMENFNHDDDFELFKAYPQMYTEDGLLATGMALKTPSREQTKPHNKELLYQDKKLVDAYKSYNNPNVSPLERFSIDEVLTAVLFSSPQTTSEQETGEDRMDIDVNEMNFIEESPEAVDDYCQSKGHIEIAEFSYIFKRKKKDPSGVVVNSEAMTIPINDSPRRSQSNSQSQSVTNSPRPLSHDEGHTTPTRNAVNSFSAFTPIERASTVSKSNQATKKVSQFTNPQAPEQPLLRKRKFTESKKAMFEISKRQENQLLLRELMESSSNHSRDVSLPQGSKSASPTIPNLNQKGASVSFGKTSFKAPSNIPSRDDDDNEERYPRDDNEMHSLFSSKKTKKIVHHKNNNK